nr:protein Mdm4 isoform X2 [Microcebus murinus]
MTSFSTSAQCSTSDSACRISTGRINQVRPKLPLLKILQAAGAQGEMFTVKEVMHYLGQYIMVKQLYDQQEQHMVYCGGDLLGELLGRQSFSVKDPSPLYDMLRKNLVTLATATTGLADSRPFKFNLVFEFNLLGMCRRVAALGSEVSKMVVC